MTKKLVVESEWEYRYIIEKIDTLIDGVKFTRMTGMEPIAFYIPMISGASTYAQLEKLRNKVILGFKNNGNKYPFEVEL